MRRMLPPSRIAPIQTGSLFERCMHVHLVGKKTRVIFSEAVEAFAAFCFCVATALFLILVALGFWGFS